MSIVLIYRDICCFFINFFNLFKYYKWLLFIELDVFVVDIYDDLLLERLVGDFSYGGVFGICLCINED